MPAKHVIIILFLTFAGTTLSSQSFMWGPKGGLTLGVQTWNGIDRQPLIAYHGAIMMESYNEGSPNAFFGQLGYHKRGSSQRITFFNPGGNPTSRSRQTFQFNNVAAIIGAKRKINDETDQRAYYSFGVRLEYTVGTNLSQFEGSQFAAYFPLDPFVNKFNYGATIGFGYEFPFSDLVGGYIEANLSPDLSQQYEQPAIPNVIDPFTGNGITIREQTIRNITFEVTVGFRFLRKVIFLDDY